MQMHSTPLPRGTHENLTDCSFQSQVRIRDDEFNPAEASSPKSLEELHPEHLVF